MNVSLISKSLWVRVTEEAERWRSAFLSEQAMHAETRTQLVLLSQQLTTMQRAGFSVAPPEPPAPPPYPQMDAEIRAALEARFPGNSTHRANALKQVDEWLISGRENKWIAQRVWDGEEPEDG